MPFRDKYMPLFFILSFPRPKKTHVRSALKVRYTIDLIDLLRILPGGFIYVHMYIIYFHLMDRFIYLGRCYAPGASDSFAFPDQSLIRQSAAEDGIERNDFQPV